MAIITGAEGLWVSDIEKQGEAYDFNNVQLSYYSALRELGINIDFISVDSDFTPYSIIIAPSLPIVDQSLCRQDAKPAVPSLSLAPELAPKPQSLATRHLAAGAIAAANSHSGTLGGDLACRLY